MLAFSIPPQGTLIRELVSLPLAPQQAANAIDADICVGMVGEDPRIPGVVPLADEDGRHPGLPNPLDG